MGTCAAMQADSGANSICWRWSRASRYCSSLRRLLFWCNLVDPPVAVVLASSSPRRSELLKWFIEEFSVDPAEIDEDSLLDDDPAVTAQRIRAREGDGGVSAPLGLSRDRGRHGRGFALGGGGWTQLAKPVDEADAVRMLLDLSGKTHTVIKGSVCAGREGFGFLRYDRGDLQEDQKSGKRRSTSRPGRRWTRRGAYGLQDESQTFVAEIRGSMTNVIGLPMERLDEALQDVIKSH